MESLEELIHSVARGEASAFRRLYDAMAPHLFSVALRIVRRRDKAEEVLQDAFTNVWRRAGDWQPDRGGAATWLTSIVHHRAIDMIRREGRLQPLDDDYAERQEDPGPDAVALVAAGEDARRLGRCLETLEDRPREAIRLAYWDGLTHEELAERLQAPVGTVKSWVRRGLIRLKDCLDR